MPKIIYSVSLEVLNHEEAMSSNLSSLQFGGRPKSTISEKQIVDNMGTAEDGWKLESVFTEENESVVIPDTSYIQNNKELRPSLNGIALAASHEVRLDTPEYTNIFGEDPRLGTKSIGQGRLAKAFIFKRDGDNIEIEKEFNYLNSQLSLSITDNDFTEMQSDGQNYILFNIKKPISLHSFKQSNIDVDINDFLLLSIDHQVFLSKYSIEEDHFFETCDYIPLESLNLQSWAIADTDVVLKAKYFPIHSHASVFIKFDSGDIEQLGFSYFDNVDLHSGTITISGMLIDSFRELGDISGFYIYYGVVPGLYLNSTEAKIGEADILSDRKSLSYYGIDPKDQQGTLAISEPLLQINRDVNYESVFTDIFVPENREDIFIETDVPIMINKKVLHPGEKYFTGRTGTQRIEVSAPLHLLDLVGPANFTSGSVIEMNSSLASNVYAVYGLFDHTDFSRLTLMAASRQDGDGDEPGDISYEAVGFGEGPFGLGGFGQGELTTYNSNVVYNISGSIPQPIFNEDMAIQVRPSRDGYQFILPAWTTDDQITVTEVNLGNGSNFTDWTFIGPDVIMLDPNKADRNTLYNIEFKAIASPVIPEINVYNGTITIDIGTDPVSSYTHFKDFYLLGGKQITLRLGYLDSLRNKTYFPNDIKVDLLISESFLKQTITGSKSILF
jgi:hypothetical protein